MRSSKGLLSLTELLKQELVPWKDRKTVVRKVIKSGFPHIYDDGHYFFDPKEVALWFKCREGIRAS